MAANPVPPPRNSSEPPVRCKETGLSGTIPCLFLDRMVQKEESSSTITKDSNEIGMAAAPGSIK